jgi:hypothetical protein
MRERAANGKDVVQGAPRHLLEPLQNIPGLRIPQSQTNRRDTGPTKLAETVRRGRALQHSPELPECDQSPLGAGQLVPTVCVHSAGGKPQGSTS